MGSFAFGLVSIFFFILAGNVGIVGIQWMEQGSSGYGLVAISVSLVCLLIAYAAGSEGIRTLK